MFWRFVAVLCAIFVVALSRDAAAQGRPAAPPTKAASVVPPGSTPVLSFESEDAEEQADAFTAAFRAKVKATPGWTLSENTFSLGILTAALKCRLDAPCLQRVGDQLKTDKFFWGRVTRVGKTQVSVEAHYWQRGKHDSVVKESYPDDLRDPGSDALKKVASRVFERLTGTLTTGTVAVRAGKNGGTVFVDGTQAAELRNGQAVLELKPGSYNVEVRAPGYLPVRQSTNVVVGAETQLTFDLVAPEAPPTPPPPVSSERPSNTRRYVAYSLIGAGAVAGIIGIVEGIVWLNKKSERADLAKGIPDTIRDTCNPQQFPPPNDDVARRMKGVCDLNDQAVTVSTIAWVSGGVAAAALGAGLVLLVTEPSSTPKTGEQKSDAKHWSLLPAIGPREQTLQLNVRF